MIGDDVTVTVLGVKGNQVQTQRHKNGISGFLKRSESPYDFFGAGHASTSISVLAGVCLADESTGLIRKRVAVIGDGST